MQDGTGRTKTGYMCTMVRDEQPWSGVEPNAGLRSTLKKTAAGHPSRRFSSCLRETSIPRPKPVDRGTQAVPPVVVVNLDPVWAGLTLIDRRRFRRSHRTRPETSTTQNVGALTRRSTTREFPTTGPLGPNSTWIGTVSSWLGQHLAPAPVLKQAEIFGGAASLRSASVLPEKSDRPQGSTNVVAAPANHHFSAGRRNPRSD